MGLFGQDCNFGNSLFNNSAVEKISPADHRQKKHQEPAPMNLICQRINVPLIIPTQTEVQKTLNRAKNKNSSLIRRVRFDSAQPLGRPLQKFFSLFNFFTKQSPPLLPLKGDTLGARLKLLLFQ